VHDSSRWGHWQHGGTPLTSLAHQPPSPPLTHWLSLVSPPQSMLQAQTCSMEHDEVFVPATRSDFLKQGIEVINDSPIMNTVYIVIMLVFGWCVPLPAW